MFTVLLVAIINLKSFCLDLSLAFLASKDISVHILLLFQIVNTDFCKTQKARHNEIIETMTKLIADIEILKNTNLHLYKNSTPLTRGLEESIHKPST